MSRRPITMAKKPKGWKTFDQLARKLVQVSKAEVVRGEEKRTKQKRGK